MTTINELILEAIRKFPDSKIYFGNKHITYKELGGEIASRAQRLVAEGVKPGTAVGVCSKPSLDMVINFFAVIQAKSICVPLDFQNPPARLAAIAADCTLSLIIGSEETCSLAAIKHLKDSAFQTKADQKTGAAAQTDEKSVSSPNEPVYGYLYSSGSEGTPKGIQCTDSGMLKWKSVWLNSLKMKKEDKTAVFAPLTFDPAPWDIIRAMFVGSDICIFDEEQRKDPNARLKFINDNKITHITLPATMLTEIDPSKLAHSVCFVSTGSQFSAQIVERFLDAKHRLFNGYGPTEVGIGATLYEIPNTAVIKDGRVPIGTPIDGMQFYYRPLDGDPNQASLFSAADLKADTDVELCISGIGLTPGYVNNPDLTKRSFLVHSKTGEPLYLSGDVVRRDTTGELYLTGRCKRFVKINGQFVNIDGIEITILNGLKDKITQTAVVPDGDPTASPKLVCFYVIKSGIQLTTEEIRAHLKQRLSLNEIPTQFKALTTIPLNANGKPDYQQLQKQLQTKSPRTPILGDEKNAESATAFETQLLNYLCDKGILNVLPQDVGVTDPFSKFCLTSFDASRLTGILTRDEKENGFGIEFRTVQLGANNTIAKLTALILKQITDKTTTIISENTKLPTIWLVHDITGNTDCYYNCVSSLSENYQIFGLDAPRPSVCFSFSESLATMAEYQIAAMRAKQPHGPYRLVGYSFGAGLAATIARKLEAQDEKIESLTLLDAPAPVVLAKLKPEQYAVNLLKTFKKLQAIFQNHPNYSIVTITHDVTLESLKDKRIAKQIDFLISQLKFSVNDEKNSELRDKLIKHITFIIKNNLLAAAGETTTPTQKIKCPVILVCTEELREQYPQLGLHYDWEHYAEQITTVLMGKESDHETVMKNEIQITQWSSAIKKAVTNTVAVSADMAVTPNSTMAALAGVLDEGLLMDAKGDPKVFLNALRIRLLQGKSGDSHRFSSEPHSPPTPKSTAITGPFFSHRSETKSEGAVIYPNTATAAHDPRHALSAPVTPIIPLTTFADGIDVPSAALPASSAQTTQTAFFSNVPTPEPAAPAAAALPLNEPTSQIVFSSSGGPNPLAAAPAAASPPTHVPT